MQRSRLLTVALGAGAFALTAVAFADLTDAAVHTPPSYYSYEPPAAGGSYTDPVFGTAVRRLSNAPAMTDNAGGGSLPWVMTEYSTMSAFNRDNTRFVLQHGSYYGLYDGVGNYLGDLPNLFAEFEESDNFAGVPMDQRVYRSVEELTAKTPQFWRTSVLPKLDNELLGLYRFLARPYPAGRNRYIDAVNQNITIIEAAIAGGGSKR